MGGPKQTIKRRGYKLSLLTVGTICAVVLIVISLTLQVTFLKKPDISSLKAITHDVVKGSSSEIERGKQTAHVPSHQVDQYKLATHENGKWEKSPKLPQWTKDYFRWHKETRSLEQSEGFDINSTEIKYLVVQCHGQSGGLADRLKLLPFYVLFANRTQRVLMFRWKTPFPLEEFLQPPEGGMDWRVPQWLVDGTQLWKTEMKNIALSETFVSSSTKILTAYVQTHAPWLHFNENIVGSLNKTYTEKLLRYRDVFGDIFRVLFQLSPPLQEMTDATMSKLGLKTGKYAAAHLRSRYAMKANGHNVDKRGGLKFENETKDSIITLSMHAINCAAKSHDLHTIYFASDSHEVSEYIMNECPFADSSSPIRVVAQQHEYEPLHLDTWDYKHKTVEEFYPVFRDLWILSNSKCMSYGIGGYGYMGVLLSGSVNCSHNYQTYTKKLVRCPAIVGKYIGGKCIDKTVKS